MKKIIAILILLGTLQFSLLANIPDSERQVLIGLYNSTNGDNWVRKDNWKKSPTEFNNPGTENTWYVVTIGIVNGNETVTGIQLYSNNLAGTIPSELGSLSNLQYLHLNSNQLMDSIPRSFDILTNLQWLNLSNNQLSGIIPVELGNAFNLQYLFLNHLVLEEVMTIWAGALVFPAVLKSADTLT